MQCGGGDAPPDLRLERNTSLPSPHPFLDDAENFGANRTVRPIFFAPVSTG
jgi:hypothetical protein